MAQITLRRPRVRWLTILGVLAFALTGCMLFMLPSPDSLARTDPRARSAHHSFLTRLDPSVRHGVYRTRRSARQTGSSVRLVNRDPRPLPTLPHLPPSPSNWSAILAAIATAASRSAPPIPDRHQSFADSYHRPALDLSPRCLNSGICDHVMLPGQCGRDGLACVTGAADRQQYIREAMQDSWKAYRQAAWGDDELFHTPGEIDRSRNWLWLGLSIVDSLDTLWVMNLKSEFKQARDWAVHKLDLDLPKKSGSVFEMNIRLVGGLLSAFMLTGGKDTALLRQAQKVADRLLGAFSTLSSVPHELYDVTELGTTIDGEATRLPVVGRANIASAGTCTLEMVTLSRFTGDPKYAATCARTWRSLTQLNQCEGLYCSWFFADDLSCEIGPHDVGLGPSADSMYEYMLKQWILTRGRDQDMLAMYKDAMGGMRRNLVVEVRQEPCAKVLQGSADMEAAVASDPSFNHALETALRENPSRANMTCAWDAPFWVLGSGVAEDSHDGKDKCGASHPPSVRHADSWWRVDTSAVPVLLHRVPRASAASHAAQPLPAVLTQPYAGISSDGRHQGNGNMQQTASHTTRRLQFDQMFDEQKHTSILRLGSPKVEHAADRIGEKIGERRAGITPNARLEHLACFIPGLLTLGHLYGADTSGKRTTNTTATPQHPAHSAQQRPLHYGEPGELYTPPQAETDDDLLLAMKLVRGCYELYRNSGTGVAGDVMWWTQQQDQHTDISKVADQNSHNASASTPNHQPPHQLYTPEYQDHSNYLRPEVVESLFYLWRATRHPIYREWGWQIFRAFHRYSRVESGAYVSVEYATSARLLRTHGRQESFWMAETLKYLYLLFSDDPDLLPLDQWVFNTEAHPLPVWGSPAETAVLKTARIRPLQW